MHHGLSGGWTPLQVRTIDITTLHSETRSLETTIEEITEIALLLENKN